MWMSFLIVLLMILLMMINRMKKIRIKGAMKLEKVGFGASAINKVPTIKVCESC